jgi:hypothetical protein
MFTILGADGKEYGPVTAGKIGEWINGGRANLQTKAKRVNDTEWKTLGDFPEFASQSAPTPSTAPAPAGAPATAPVTGSIKEIADAYSTRAAKIDVFGCLGRSFDFWKSNLLPLVGVTLLVLLAQMILGFIPILGMLTGLFLNGVFCGGIYYYYLGKMRGEPREVGDAFAGFSRAFVPLMLASLLTSVLIVAVMLPFFGPFFLVMGQAILAGGQTPPALGGASVGLILLGVIPMIYLSIAWVFTFVLVIDKGLGPWTAMEVGRRVVTRQWFRVFFVALLGAIIAMLGLIGLIIGIFFTLPLMFGAVLYAYEDLFNPPAAS